MHARGRACLEDPSLAFNVFIAITPKHATLGETSATQKGVRMKKIVVGIMLVGSVCVASHDWYAEKDILLAQQQAMAYFWQQPTKVSCEDIRQAVAKFSQEEVLETLTNSFFDWQDDAGNTFLHTFVQQSDNVQLLSYILRSFGPDVNIENNAGKTVVDLAGDKHELKKLLEQYENDPEFVKNAKVPHMSHNVVFLQQRMIVAFILASVAYYGWQYVKKTDNNVVISRA